MLFIIGSVGTNVLQLSGSLAGIFLFSPTAFGTSVKNGQSIQTYTSILFIFISSNIYYSLIYY